MELQCHETNHKCIELQALQGTDHDNIGPQAFKPTMTVLSRKPLKLPTLTVLSCNAFKPTMTLVSLEPLNLPTITVVSRKTFKLPTKIRKWMRT
jgi:hypothetical protein